MISTSAARASLPKSARLERVARALLSAGALAALSLTSAEVAAFPQSTHPAMTDPSKATERAPESFRARFDTTKGAIVLECTRSWAPHGVDRFYNLVKIGFFDDVAFFRVKPGFVAQWGIHGDPKVSAAWRDARLPPDPVTQSNTRGMLTYAMAGQADTRTTQVFLNFGDNSSLDAMGFAPLCKVVSGMEVADALYGGYAERVTGKQGEIQRGGNAYLRETWPELDYVKTATIEGEAPSPERGSREPSASPEASGSWLPYALGGLVGAGALYWLTRGRQSPSPKGPASPERARGAAPREPARAPSGKSPSGPSGPTSKAAPSSRSPAAPSSEPASKTAPRAPGDRPRGASKKRRKNDS
jgi:peptidyl-prolyl cis-trans isomerase A (cyclophilin A)